MAEVVTLFAYAASQYGRGYNEVSPFDEAFQLFFRASRRRDGASSNTECAESNFGTHERAVSMQ